MLIRRWVGTRVSVSLLKVMHEVLGHVPGANDGNLVDHSEEGKKTQITYQTT